MNPDEFYIEFSKCEGMCLATIQCEDFPTIIITQTSSVQMWIGATTMVLKALFGEEFALKSAGVALRELNLKNES